ncbi:MAG: AAA family ATPase [Candidatus Ornithospirochaeta sp.]|nr:AAA family ATPase [Sphaerochaetaceae bacterium]MDY5522539.1 AAA family ATPase [Candidatus Ornithospirochaeta sp.]
MGTYVNPGTERFRISRNSRFYVDKSMIISLLNDKVESDDRFLCVSRPRRFGKTMAANMIAAYYSKGCDSHEIFSDLKISKDPTFEDNINRYTVIKLDINGAATGKGDKTIVQYYNENVMPELMKAYPDVALSSDMSLAKALVAIYEETGDKFVFIIDEYDLPIRDGKYASELDEYIAFLVSLFKSEETNYTIALAYLTGIMPIIREKVQSKLNNFTEYTMLDADDMAPFMGFTEEEVQSLAQKSGMAFDDLKRWYDGYNLKGLEIYSPKSVISAVTKKSCDDYWTQTSSYRALKDFILMDFEGIRKDIVSMISGSLVPVNVRKFTNTPWEIESRDDVFTCLIHLGYLGYDSEERSCFIPNYELMEEWISAIEDTSDYRSVVDLIRDSKALMEATWNGDEEAVAEAVAKAHTEACSIQKYNNEGSFQSALHLAYYYAKSCYTIVNELPGGKGFADVAFIPYKPDIPAIIIELKKDDTTSAAISQIRERKYPEALEKYRDNLLLVAITYDSKTKEHGARIEKA